MSGKRVRVMPSRAGQPRTRNASRKAEARANPRPSRAGQPRTRNTTRPSRAGQPRNRQPLAQRRLKTKRAPPARAPALVSQMRQREGRAAAAGSGAAQPDAGSETDGQWQDGGAVAAGSGAAQQDAGSEDGPSDEGDSDSDSSCRSNTRTLEGYVCYRTLEGHWIKLGSKMLPVGRHGVA